MGGECPLNCVCSNYLVFISQVEMKATLRGAIGIAPRNLLTPIQTPFDGGNAKME
jgi:hypothetical protein